MVINASPRKRWNTAQIMKSASEGAKSVGADVEYIDLYDIDLRMYELFGLQKQEN